MKIVIVGGGTAGWLTAFALSHDRKDHSYTIIDSSKIGIIGVGESTTGAFSNFAINRGISKFELIKETNALPKYGIKFFDWSPTNKEYTSPVDGSYSSENFIDWALYTSLLTKKNLTSSSLGASIIENNKTDYYINKSGKLDHIFGHFPLHIDTFATGNFFKKKCLNNRVQHIDSIVKDVIINNQTGFIEKLQLDDNTVVEGDMFIDCTGFSQTLIKHLDLDWVDYSNFLPVNSAIPFNVNNDNNNKHPYTTAKAMSSGWLWEIPTKNHINRGYIFCDKFISTEDAVDEIKQIYGNDITYNKVIKFNAGRLNNPWIKNCIAIGLSSAFLEPLQATSIHCTVAQIEDFINNCLGSSIFDTIDLNVINLYNARISELYSSMADLISLHYTGKRCDTDFWRSMINKQTPKVEKILKLSKTRGLRNFDFDTKYAHAGQAIWNNTVIELDHYDLDAINNLFEQFGVNLFESSYNLNVLYNQNLQLLENCLSLQELDKYLKEDN